MTGKTYFKFLAGDDVPPFVLRPKEGSDPVEYIRFCVDVEVVRSGDKTIVWPLAHKPEGVSMVTAAAVESRADINLTGNPTEWNLEPRARHKKDMPNIKTSSSMIVLDKEGI